MTSILPACWQRAAAATALAHDIPELAYQAQHLQGRLALSQDDTAAAFLAYDAAILQLERLCGRLMIEHRASFLEDKDVLYGDMVFLCLDQDLPERGLEYAERAKSRALLDLLAYRLDLSIRARSPHDEAIVQELDLLRAERDRIGRRRESKEEVSLRGDNGAVPDPVLVLEKRITDLWHELLVRNADYARDAALWQVRSEVDPTTLGLDNCARRVLPGSRRTHCLRGYSEQRQGATLACQACRRYSSKPRGYG